MRSLPRAAMMHCPSAHHALALSALLAFTAALTGCPSWSGARSFSVAPEGVAISTSGGVAVRAGDVIATPTGWVRGVNEGLGLCVDWGNGLPDTEPFEEDGLHDPGTVIYLSIEHPSMPPGETLYGALVLCSLIDRAPMSVRQLYRLEIPPQFVEATTDGRRAFVSETYLIDPERPDPGHARAWALWIQRTPFR